VTAERAPRYPSIERIECPSAAELRQRFVRARKPVVLRGAADRWPARGRWSPEYFASQFGDALVRTYAMPHGEIRLDTATGFVLHEMRVRDYVAHVRDDGPVAYYLRAPIAGTLAALADDVRTPEVCRRVPRPKRNLWFAKRGTVTRLHFDLPHNLFAQVYGRKRFILFAPAESSRLYRHPWTSSVPHVARADPERADDARFPLFREAHGWHCELEPGDVLFIPSRWWHHARAIEHCISVNFWFLPTAVLPLALASDLYKRIRGLNI
jgi:hypothetical protein